MSHQPPPHGHGHGPGHHAYNNYSSLPPQNQPMMMPIPHPHQFQPPNAHFFMHSHQNQTVLGGIPQYVGQQNINAMHPNSATNHHPGFGYQVRQIYHPNNYAGFNGTSPVMLPHPPSMVMRPPARIDMETLQAKNLKPPMPGIPLQMPPQPITYIDQLPPPKMYTKPSTRSAAVKIVHPDTGEDVVEQMRKERETKSNDSSVVTVSSTSSRSIMVPDIIDKHEKFNDSKLDENDATPDLLNQTGYASTSMSLSFVQSEEEDLNASAESPKEVIKDLLKKPNKEEIDEVVEEIVEEVDTVENSVCDDEQEEELADDSEITKDDSEDVDDEEVVETVEVVEASELSEPPQPHLDISTETISDEELFDDESSDTSAVEEVHSNAQSKPDPLPLIVEKIDKLDLDNGELAANANAVEEAMATETPAEETQVEPNELTNFTKETTKNETPKHRGKTPEYSRSKLLELRHTPLAKRKPTSIPMHIFMLLQKTDVNKVNASSRGPNLHPQHNFSNLFPKFINPQMNAQQQYNFQNQMQMQNKRLNFQNPNMVQNFPKPVIRLSLSKEVKLNVAENAWKPRHLTAGQTAAPVVEDEVVKLEKTFRSILNKLTPDNFDVLLEQIHKLNIENQEQLERCIILLFEKAISEPLFAPCYASMCQEIATMYVPHKEREKVTFRYILVHHCQKEFEKHRTDRINQLDKTEKMLLEASNNDKAKYAELEQELQVEKNRIRHRAVGTIRFIGELYKIEMLKSSIMMECIKILWEYGDTKSLECLCKLLTTIGKPMEEKGYRDQLGEYFDKLEDIIEKKTIDVESRIRFMIMDLLDLRNKNWRPRQPMINPTPINQYRN